MLSLRPDYVPCHSTFILCLNHISHQILGSFCKCRSIPYDNHPKPHGFFPYLAGHFSLFATIRNRLLAQINSLLYPALSFRCVGVNVFNKLPCIAGQLTNSTQLPRLAVSLWMTVDPSVMLVELLTRPRIIPLGSAPRNQLSISVRLPELKSRKNKLRVLSQLGDGNTDGGWMTASPVAQHIICLPRMAVSYRDHLPANRHMATLYVYLCCHVRILTPASTAPWYIGRSFPYAPTLADNAHRPMAGYSRNGIDTRLIARSLALCRGTGVLSHKVDGSDAGG